VGPSRRHPPLGRCGPNGFATRRHHVIAIADGEQVDHDTAAPAGLSAANPQGATVTGARPGTRDSLDPTFGQQWSATEDGRRFMRLSGEAWCEANVTGAADPAWARAAADRTLAAYLGEA
jgi:hypothetical protein